MLNPKWRKFNLISGHNIFLTHHINLISHHSMSFSPSAGRKTALFRSLPRSQGRGQRLSDCVRSIEGLWLETMSSVNHPMCFFVYCHLFHRWNHDGVNCIKAVGVWEKKKKQTGSISFDGRLRLEVNAALAVAHARERLHYPWKRSGLYLALMYVLYSVCHHLTLRRRCLILFRSR